MTIVLTPEGIANSLEHIHTDGSSWLIPNWHYDYRNMKFNLIYALKYDTGWNKIDYVKDIESLKKWKDSTSNWETIIENNDIAMFPPQLICLKKFYLTHMDMDCCEAINQLSYNTMHSEELQDLFHRRLHDFYEEYGVFRFKTVIGDNLYKMLRKHLKVSDDEFRHTYGLSLYYDKDACDELLIEMLATGRLTGVVRAYKIESDGFYGL